MIKEYEYFDKNGNLIYATGIPIEDIIEDNTIKDKRISELETALCQKQFELEKERRNAQDTYEMWQASLQSINILLKKVDK